MDRSFQLYTATMAKLYADQGYLRKAAEIYRHLVIQNPGRKDLREALEAVEGQLVNRSNPDWKELRLMVQDYMVLLKSEQRRKQRKSSETQTS